MLFPTETGLDWDILKILVVFSCNLYVISASLKAKYFEILKIGGLTKVPFRGKSVHSTQLFLGTQRPTLCSMPEILKS